MRGAIFEYATRSRAAELRAIARALGIGRRLEIIPVEDRILFIPTIIVGTAVGLVVVAFILGGVVHSLAPDYTSGMGAYALVGMGATFAGILRAPMTSVIMIFEITRDYSIIGPLMIANLVSYFLSGKLQPEPIYDALQQQNGVHPPRGARSREVPLTVRLALRTDSVVLNASEPIREAAHSVDRQRGAWPVLQPGGLRGMVTFDRMEEAIAAGRGGEPLGDLVPTERLSTEAFPHVHLDDSLDFAMEQIAATGIPVLPVVSRTHVREFEGTISVPDIVAAYRVGRSLESHAGEERPKHLPFKLLIAISLGLTTMAIATGTLSSFSRSSRKSQAEVSRQAGDKLMAEARYEEAITEYRDALAASHSIDDRSVLAVALMKSGTPHEASLYRDEVLHSSPNSGLANLGMARISAQAGRTERPRQRRRSGRLRSTLRNTT